MLKRMVSVFIPFLFLSLIGNAQDNSSNTPLFAAKAWWHATTFGDTAYLKKHSTDELTVTFNNGRSFTHSEIIAQVATHSASASINLEWSEIVEQTPAPQTAIITNRIVETVGAMPHNYKFITVLVNVDSQWKVAAAQSTRVVELARPFAIADLGKLKDYVGGYRTPRGIILKILHRDTSLVLVEPSGKETRLEAIAPDLFEISQILSAGNVRFAFSRDATGGVTAMTRIAHNIVTMSRIK
jgi:hypothetical protein